MADPRPALAPPSPGRLEALPGSLGKVTICAVFTLGIAAFISVRRWLAARSAENKAGHGSSGSTTASKYGFRSKSKVSSSGGGGAGSSSTALAGKDDDGASGGAAPSSPQRPQLPPRNYFTIRAALHVKRHNAKMMEWFDEQLGVQLPFSQQLFELRQEERQAPLILLSFRTLREPTHRMAVTIEELYSAQTATTYCEASLSRIADCAKVLGTSSTRIGSKEYPVAEYCYVDDTQTTVFAFSIFVVHERLAVTLQYVAPSRVHNVMPTAFYDIARFMVFTAPSPSPSYLLISEPRLGLGFHLPLDFLVHEGLAESDCVEDRLFTSIGGASEGGPPVLHGRSNSREPQPQQPRGDGGLATVTAYSSRPYGGGNSGSGGGGGFYAGYGEGGEGIIPYVTAMSRGGRRMGLITSYEPSIGINTSSSNSNLMDAAAGGPPGWGSTSRSAGGVPYAWRPYLEQQVSKAVRQLGLVMGPSVGGYGAGPRVLFQPPDPSDLSAYASAAHTLLIEPYPLSIALNGNFSAGDDSRDEEGGCTAHVTAFSLFREVRVDVNSSYVTLVPDTLDAASARTTTASADAAYHRRDGSPVTVAAFWSAFYVPVGTACVSFHFIASALRHTSTEFVSFCATVMNSISLGNHYGQTVSLMYCNTRHDVLPFRLSLPPTGMATAEEPMLADPLCVVQATYGVEKVAVTVRVFPLFAANAAGRGVSAAGGSVQGGTTTTTTTTTAGSPDTLSTSLSKPPPPPLLRPAERRGTRQRSAMRQLQYMLRYYLAQFPGGVHLISYTKTTVNSMPAMLLCFRPMRTVNGEERGGSAAATESTNGNGGGGGVPSSGSAGALNNNWDDFSGGAGASSQGASSWVDMRESMLEEEVGQLNPFAHYFAPPPPPVSYLRGSQQGNNPSSSSAPTQPVTAAAMKKAAGDSHHNIDGDFVYTGGGGGDSQRSQEELDDPLRVALAVCCEGNAFLFQTSASEYTLGTAQEAVQAAATYLALIPRAG
ncbi:hypothetical protein ABB37_01882 [Leptomonas pyrrhocoris]|uniref:Uncharacterized protein n=1 Tax=Leptomonas pyrrhocoris TaxID=157538 RepID=A0A0N0VGG9_LEPPY|nr:hypothetical protein ABB37_01882 [Leptomonas pyrrhocoris]XP_015662044.1 hypothetical protein ABB37_01882 [Leptomonas pyrrhocoris]XP_015662045.1 hypothetical protein ABB37_01882 [Leptomonas pyrrhocoris]KPA83604.1 hypothetical protein ABB37_01882 [Leptomonas pyrrhocoris]KPA83605.1 hypothetical protein ABB37_01882 [Leptomonas pyrrhocoris]KPA83606.1 hypothetical protein ABB37_01882 [Leptomonas pyrrhocoris]|eukprot:XP_015662043.1 hypothetical protein ABB37_01882 [Leptomonas pyrrhocoris]